MGAALAIGHIPPGRNPEVRRVVIGLDAETFGQVRDRALRAHHSFAEEARTLIEWGLEAANAA